MLSGFRIPAIEEAAGGVIAARHAGDQHAVGDERRARRGVAFREVGKLLLPYLCAGFHVERNDVRVERHTKELAVVDGRRAAVDRAAASVRRRFRRRVGGRAPDLPAGRKIDGKSPFTVHYVHHAVVYRGLRQFAQVVHQAHAPDRNQPLHIG